MMEIKNIQRHGFTMIELIFVIVILGILGALAIPRLAATRDDASNVVMAQSIMTAAGEIGSYVVAHGESNESLSVMSGAITSLVSSEKAHLNTVEKSAYFHMGDITDCIVMDINSSSNDENLTILYGNANGDSHCLGLQSVLDIEQYPMKLRGASIEH
ncbi:MAG: hypothetical protein A2W83_01995 [Sulfuricurvum sp. RIFCSPLOWO2_12_43_5]|nr:MAG: hypothetical protein A2W83_01995 [Sulfuricurvum sp. RIFCSPLOWO2_12_43_5]OHD88820.1 MAG: hypothetical protein A3G19_04705 [Sulfuricurvum sp. RIFCSPLOWO2_12_FULL_43_24]